jgi:hypothetical protein
MSSIVSSTGVSWKIQIGLDPGFIYYMGFEVLIMVNIHSMVVIQDVMICSLTKGFHCFRGTLLA